MKFQKINGRVCFYCPGCEQPHEIVVDGSRGWTFDEKTITAQPSLLVSSRENGVDVTKCHSYIRNGQWQFLDDCKHDLAGQTVDLPEFPGWLEEFYAST